jgi:hypothetical protein
MVFVIALPLLFLLGIFKPPSVDYWQERKNKSDRFWLLKTHNRSKFDIVLVGDSRVYRGLSPEAMEDVLAGCRIFNFGYSAGGLNPVILSEAERMLHSRGEKRTIIAGISPYSLTDEANCNESFLQYKAKLFKDRVLLVYFESVLSFFRPVTLEDVLYAMSGRSVKPAKYYYEEFHDDGWVASWTVPERPQEALEVYREIFSRTKVSSSVINEFLRKTRQLVGQGIHVIAFRMPSSQTMIALEDALSGFDEKQFARQFEAAGGVWLNVPGNGYHSYDGSHLHKDSAVRLSRDLAFSVVDRVGKF